MWDNWNRSTTAQIRVQEVSDVLDPNYIPPNQEARDLFIKQHKFMYAVFKKPLFTNKGKALGIIKPPLMLKQSIESFLHMQCNQPRHP